MHWPAGRSMPRTAELSPNTFQATPSDCSACVSGCTPDGEWFAFFSFTFEGGGAAVFELRLNVKQGVRRILRRGPAMVVTQDDIVELLEWRKRRLALDGVRYLQVTPVVAKQMVDSAIERCGQTLLDRQPWGKSWHALNVCVFTLQFRHRDYAEDICDLDLRLGTSSTDCVLREAAPTQEMDPALRATTQNGLESPDYLGLGVVPLVGGAGTNARCRLRGTFVKHRQYNFRDATTISPQHAATRFNRPGTVAGAGHADVSHHMLHRALSKTAQQCVVKHYDGWQKVETRVPLFQRIDPADKRAAARQADGLRSMSALSFSSSVLPNLEPRFSRVRAPRAPVHLAKRRKPGAVRSARASSARASHTLCARRARRAPP